MKNTKRKLDFDFDKSNPIITVRPKLKDPKKTPAIWPPRYQALFQLSKVTLGLNYPWYHDHNGKLKEFVPTTFTQLVNKLKDIDVDKVAKQMTQSMANKPAKQSQSNVAKSVHKTKRPKINAVNTQTVQRKPTRVKSRQTVVQKAKPNIKSSPKVSQAIEYGIGGVVVNNSASTTPNHSVANFVLGSGKQNYKQYQNQQASNSTSQPKLIDYMQSLEQNDRIEEQLRKLKAEAQQLYTEYQASVKKIKAEHAEKMMFAQQESLYLTKKARHRYQVTNAFAKHKLNEWSKAGTMVRHLRGLEKLEQYVIDSEHDLNNVKTKCLATIDKMQANNEAELQAFEIRYRTQRKYLEKQYRHYKRKLKSLDMLI